MKSMGFKLSNEYSEKAQTIMKNMGCHPNFGLGRYLQGRKDPIVAELRKPRQGMGFSKGPLGKEFPLLGKQRSQCGFLSGLFPLRSSWLPMI